MIKRFTLLVAIGVLFAFAIPTVSFAGGTGSASTENTFIAEGSDNSKASPLVLKFEPGTIFKAGDTMQFALTSSATLAKDIDIFVGDKEVGANKITSGNINTWTFDGTAGGLLTDQSLTTSPVVGSNAATYTTSDGGVAFRFVGSAGSDKILMSILGTPVAGGSDGSLVGAWGTGQNQSQGTLTVGNGAGSQLIIRVLDEQTYATSMAFNDSAGVFKKGTTTTLPNLGYDTAVTASDNALCIDVSAPGAAPYTAPDGTNINMAVMTTGTVYTFTNAPFTVAYITGSGTIVRTTTTKLSTGTIPLGAAATQTTTATTCTLIDNDKGIGTTYALAADGFCATTHRSNKLILQTSSGSAFSASKLYSLKLTILVNGLTAEGGVYWSGGGTSLAYSMDSASTEQTLIDDTAASNSFGTLNAYKADGTTAATMVNTTTCTIAAANRATVLESSAYTTLGLTTGGVDNFIWFPIPPMVYDTATFNDGDVISVRAQLSEAPCGIVYDSVGAGNMTIGTATTSCSQAPPSTTYTMLYPYFPDPSNGILDILYALNNTDTAGTATVTVYEADGDVFTATPIVGARGMLEINYATDFAGLSGYAQSAGTGTLGDSPFYAVISTQFATGGACLIYQTATGLAASYDVVAK